MAEGTQMKMEVLDIEIVFLRERGISSNESPQLQVTAHGPVVISVLCPRSGTVPLRASQEAGTR